MVPTIMPLPITAIPGDECRTAIINVLMATPKETAGHIGVDPSENPCLDSCTR